MREHPFPPPPDILRQPTPADWLIELGSILFDAAGPAENRLESFLDRLERRA